MNLELDEEELYVACQICQTHFDVDTLLENSDNEFYCGDCFKKSITRGRKSNNAGDQNDQSPDKWGKKLIPHPEQYTDNNQTINLSSASSSTMSLSYRPLRCPKIECNRYISICTLEAHIQHEHREIPIILARLDTRCSKEFHPSDIKYKIPKCMAVLKIIDERVLTKTRHPQEDQHLMIVVMAARITHESTVTDDKIIIWLASDIQSSFSHSVAVSTAKNDPRHKGVMQKFYGPLLTLNESAEDVYKSGNCLILTHRQCIEMTQNGANPLILDYVVHS